MAEHLARQRPGADPGRPVSLLAVRSRDRRAGSPARASAGCWSARRSVWSNFLLPLVLTESGSVAVLPLGLTKLEGLYSVNVPAVTAGPLLPLLILFVLMRRQVMNSLGGLIAR